MAAKILMRMGFALAACKAILSTIICANLAIPAVARVWHSTTALPAMLDTIGHLLTMGSVQHAHSAATSALYPQIHLHTHHITMSTATTWCAAHALMATIYITITVYHVLPTALLASMAPLARPVLRPSSSLVCVSHAMIPHMVAHSAASPALPISISFNASSAPMVTS